MASEGPALKEMDKSHRWCVGLTVSEADEVDVLLSQQLGKPGSGQSVANDLSGFTHLSQFVLSLHQVVIRADSRLLMFKKSGIDESIIHFGAGQNIVDPLVSPLVTLILAGRK